MPEVAAMRRWEQAIPATDREVHAAAGYGKPLGLGARPAVLVVDVNYRFLGRHPEPILRSVALWPKSSGERGWAALTSIQALLTAGRRAGVPVLFTTGQPDIPRGPQGEKSRQDGEGSRHPDELAIVEAVAPRPGELIIAKPRASAFFGTGLVAYLVEHGVDTLLIAGCTTSGCVRATVVDAAAYGFKVGVVEECVFDRFEISHNVTLFDLNAKYADVMSLADAERYLDERARR